MMQIITAPSRSNSATEADHDKCRGETTSGGDGYREGCWCRPLRGGAAHVQVVDYWVEIIENACGEQCTVLFGGMHRGPLLGQTLPIAHQDDKGKVDADGEVGDGQHVEGGQHDKLYCLDEALHISVHPAERYHHVLDHVAEPH